MELLINLYKSHIIPITCATYHFNKFRESAKNLFFHPFTHLPVEKQRALRACLEHYLMLHKNFFAFTFWSVFTFNIFKPGPPQYLELLNKSDPGPSSLWFNWSRPLSLLFFGHKFFFLGG